MHARSVLTSLVLFALIVGSARAQTAGEWKTDFSKSTINLAEIVFGGPPKDGIPAIDEPVFETVEQASRWLEDREPVIVVEHAGEARAYPYQVLIWHEIVNDRIGDLPLAVTFCPLCNTALVFESRLDGRGLDFGTTGRLRHSDLVMYDRQTESWWQQATGEAIVGELAGKELRFFPAQTVSWSEFERAHPDGKVLSKKTGYNRPYGRNPYAGYDDPGGGPIPRMFRGMREDDRLPAMERVVAVRLDDETVAYPFARLEVVKVVNDDIAGHDIVVFWAAGTASALDRSSISSGRDVGASGVFHRRIDGRDLTFEPHPDGGFLDRETRTRWDLLGRGVEGRLEGSRLEPVPHGDYFWFAWAAFQPETRIWK